MLSRRCSPTANPQKPNNEHALFGFFSVHCALCVIEFDMHLNNKHHRQLYDFKCKQIATVKKSKYAQWQRDRAIVTFRTSSWMLIIHIYIWREMYTPSSQKDAMNSLNFKRSEMFFSNRMHRNSNLIALSWFVFY